MNISGKKRSGFSKLCMVAAVLTFSACSVFEKETAVATVSTFDMATADVGQVADALAEDGRVIIRGITFDTGSAELSGAAYASVTRVGEVMARNQALNLAVVGYTDNTGDFQSNLELSKRRAESIVKALKDDFDVSADRLAPVGAGELAAVADNNSDFGRSQNRRVELVVIND